MNSASARTLCIACGARPISGRIVWSDIRHRTTRTLKRKPPTSLASIYTRRATRPSSAWMKSPRFQPSTAATACSRCHPAASNGTASNTSATGRSRSTRPSTRRPVRSRGTTTARHTSQDFVEFLGEVVASCDPDQEIYIIILDNLSAHKTPKVAAFLEQHPNVSLHFTPTYSSWLNQIELWFSKVQRDVIARGIFTSTADLARKLRRYINAYAQHAKPRSAGSIRSPRVGSDMVKLSLRQSTSSVGFHPVDGRGDESLELPEGSAVAARRPAVRIMDFLAGSYEVAQHLDRYRPARRLDFIPRRLIHRQNEVSRDLGREGLGAVTADVNTELQLHELDHVAARHVTIDSDRAS